MVGKNVLPLFGEKFTFSVNLSKNALVDTVKFD